MSWNRLVAALVALVFATMPACIVVSIRTPAGEPAGPSYYSLLWKNAFNPLGVNFRNNPSSAAEYIACDITTPPTPAPGAYVKQPPAGLVEFIGTPFNPYLMQPIRAKLPISYVQTANPQCGPGDKSLFVGAGDNILPLVGYRVPSGWDPGIYRKCVVGKELAGRFPGFYDISYCPDGLGATGPAGYYGYLSNTESYPLTASESRCNNGDHEPVPFLQCDLSTGNKRTGDDCISSNNGGFAGAVFSPGANVSDPSSPDRLIFDQLPGGNYEVTIGTDYYSAGRCNSGTCNQPCGNDRGWYDFQNLGTFQGLQGVGGAAYPHLDDLRWHFKARLALRRDDQAARDDASMDALLDLAAGADLAGGGLHAGVVLAPSSGGHRTGEDGPWHQDVCNCCAGTGSCAGDKACVAGRRYECAVMSTRDTGAYDGAHASIDSTALGYASLQSYYQDYHIDVTEIFLIMLTARRKNPVTGEITKLVPGFTSLSQASSYNLTWVIETSGGASMLMQVKDSYVSNQITPPLPTPVRTATPTPRPTPTRTPLPTPTRTPVRTPTPTPRPTPTPPPATPTPRGVTPTPVRSTPTPTPVQPHTPTPTPTRTPVGVTPTPTPVRTASATGEGSWFPQLGGVVLPGEPVYASLPGDNLATGAEEFWYCSPDQITDARLATALPAAWAQARRPGCMIAEPYPFEWCYYSTLSLGSNFWTDATHTTLKPGIEMPETLGTTGATKAQVLARLQFLLNLGISHEELMVVPVVFGWRNRLPSTSQLFIDLSPMIPPALRTTWATRLTSWPKGASNAGNGVVLPTEWIDLPDALTVEADAACLSVWLYALNAQHPEIRRVVVQVSNGAGGYGYGGLGYDAGQKFAQVLAQRGYRRELQLEAVMYDLAAPGTWPFNGPGTFDCPFYLRQKADNSISWFDTHHLTDIRDQVSACAAGGGYIIER